MYKEKNSYSIHGIPVLKDNIIWILVKGTEAVVIDPAIAKPVEIWLKNQNLKLIAVLQTHHHDDHIGGTKSLIKQWPGAPVIASGADRNRIPFQTLSVTGGDDLTLMGLSMKVLAPIIVSDKEPLSIVLLAPISTPSSKITLPICGVLKFLLGIGIKPNP